MLRIHSLQQWYGLSDPAAEDTLYEITSMRRFAKLSLTHNRIPDESTILQFRHLLEKHKLAEDLFSEVNAYLQEKGLMLRRGTLVDATIIDAPSSTKNKERKRDPQIHQTGKGNQWKKPKLVSVLLSSIRFASLSGSSVSARHAITD